MSVIDFRTSVRPDGVVRMVAEPAGSVKTVLLHGFRFAPAPAVDATTPTTTTYDLPFAGVVELQGFDLLVFSGAHIEDTARLDVVMPAGTSKATWEAILGEGTWPPGMPDPMPVDVVLRPFAESIYPPLDGSSFTVIMDGTSTLAAPLFLRMSYTAHDYAPATPVEVRGMVRIWK